MSNSTFDYDFDYTFSGEGEERYDPHLITIDEAVANAMTIIDNATDRDKVFFRQWVYLAERQIGLPSLYHVPAKVLVNEYSIRKPDNCISVSDLMLYDDSDCMIPYRLKLKSGQLVDRAYHNPSYPLTITESMNHFHLDIGTPESCKASYAILEFNALPIDGDGNLMIHESHLFPIMRFIKYMHALRTDSGKTQEYSLEWKLACKKVKADNKMPSKLQAREIAKTFNSMIQKSELSSTNTYGGKIALGKPCGEPSSPTNVSVLLESDNDRFIDWEE